MTQQILCDIEVDASVASTYLHDVHRRTGVEVEFVDLVRHVVAGLVSDAPGTADVVAAADPATHLYLPLAGGTRVCVVVRVGGVRERPVAVAGRVVVRPILALTVTFDAAVFDDTSAAAFAAAVHDYLANPNVERAPGVGTIDLTDAGLACLM